MFKTHQKFIVFQYEGNTIDNKYHAFHLEGSEIQLQRQKKFPNDDMWDKLKEKFGLK